MEGRRGLGKRTKEPESDFSYSSGDSCLNLTRLDWTRPDDWKTQEEYQTYSEEFAQVRQLGRSAVGLVWEKPAMMAQRPVDDAEGNEDSKAVREDNADHETGLQQEEEPDLCRQGCMKEDGEV
ncbi:hypothetical protein Bbelb_162580 [Branchiostoma belcheri]|nr:hypothetical protein Bbelb_162580 [Branchiostoma belcheri]